MNQTSKQLTQKYKEIRECSDIISLLTAKQVTREIAAKVEDLQTRLQFRLAQLVDDFAIQEANTKIEIYKEVIKALKNQ